MRKAAMSGTVIAGVLLGAPALAESLPPDWQKIFSAVEMKPTIGFSTGYDSNPEELVDANGALLRRLDAGLRLTMGSEDTTRAVANVSGSVIGYGEPEIERDYNHAEGVELSHRLNGQLRILAGANRNTDGTDDPVTKAAEAWSRVDVDLPKVQWVFRGTIAKWSARPISRRSIWRSTTM